GEGGCNMVDLEIKAGSCTRCGRGLKDPVSLRRGMGPVCWARSRGGTFDRLLDASDEEWQTREDLLRAGGEEDLGANWRWPLFVDGVTITVQARISVRYDRERDRYEAYARVFDPRAPYDEV